MARNVVKFATRGTVRVFPVSSGGSHGVTVVVRDDLAMRIRINCFDSFGVVSIDEHATAG